MAERGKPILLLVITQQDIDTFPACSVKSINVLISWFCHSNHSMSARSTLPISFASIDRVHLTFKDKEQGPPAGLNSQITALRIESPRGP